MELEYLDSTDSESDFSDDDSDLEEWMEISRRMLSSDDEDIEINVPVAPELQFECDYCGKFLTRKDNLLFYMFMKHISKRSTS